MSNSTVRGQLKNMKIVGLIFVVGFVLGNGEHENKMNLYEHGLKMYKPIRTKAESMFIKGVRRELMINELNQL